MQGGSFSKTERWNILEELLQGTELASNNNELEDLIKITYFHTSIFERGRLKEIATIVLGQMSESNASSSQTDFLWYAWKRFTRLSNYQSNSRRLQFWMVDARHKFSSIGELLLRLSWASEIASHLISTCVNLQSGAGFFKGLSQLEMAVVRMGAE